ncbi:MAG: M15 family metallopeptidase [Parcubacteria group bacterium]
MIKIKDCHEPLVDLKKVCPKLIVALQKHRLKKEKTAYVRKTVARMLCDAQNKLPVGMTFVINDAWRPQYVQEGIMQWFIKKAKKQFPNASREKVLREIKNFVAPADGVNASGHMTGGAVDIRLWKDGKKVPMKSARLNYQENSEPFQKKLPDYLKRNRQIMFDALESVGFSNHPKEFWHWSYGDIHWARRNKKKVAIYGVKEV